MKIKYLFSTIAIQFAIVNVSGQQIPTGPPISPFSPPPVLEQHAWYRGGNNLGAAGANKNIFGTLWNSPIYTITNGAVHMKLNATLNYAVNPGSNASRTGFLLLTNNPNATAYPGGITTSLVNNPNYGAFSLLHLVGDASINVQDNGYRNWMRNGLLFSNNFDAGFIGVRPMPNTLGGTDDVSDFVINWSDNFGSSPALRSPDNLVFCFTSGDGNGNNDLVGNSANGRETMRHTSEGKIGIGPRFSNAFQPKSTFHIHEVNDSSAWIQISNQLMALLGGNSNTAPTPMSTGDGLRIGILGNSNLIQNGNAFIFNQEKRHIIFSTGFATPWNMTNSFERMRITAIENPTTLTGGGYGIYNPAGLPVDRTRVAISAAPTQPITRPLSLLHLGFNTGLASATPGTTDGWRPWMDIGTFTTNGTDNIYLGLKQEGTSTDQSDAVINWGDNQSNSSPTPFPPNGPDNLRFIFTATQTGAGGTPPATGNDGLEVARMAPNGNMGIGNFYNNPFATFTRTPANRLEILSDKTSVNANGNPQLRLTNFQQDPANLTTTGKYAELHETANGDLGILVYDNTISSTNTTDQFFSEKFVGINTNTPGNTLEINSQYATFITPNGQPAPPASAAPTGWAGLRFTDLTSISAPQVNPGKGVLAVDANGDVIYVPNNGGNNFGGICGSNPPSMIADWEIPIGNFTYNYRGIGGVVNITDNTNCNKFSKLFVTTASRSAAIVGINNALAPLGGTIYGGYFQTTSTVGPTSNSYALYCNAPVTGTPSSPPSPSSLALFADGDVFVSGTAYLANPAIVTSDQMFKTNIDSIQSAINIVKQLKPVTFDYDQSYSSRFNFPSGRNYGFIAQDVEQVIPELVKNSIAPATTDSLGNLIYSSLPYKSLNYQGIIPVLTKAIQEQQAQIASKDSAINSLNDRLTALENCINALNLCGNPQAINQNNNSMNTTAMPVELSDAQAIVLEQNVPNPFAEQTTINYFLPENVIKAQMLFYNAQGKLIQSVELSQKGKGSINVFAQDLSSGIYTYTLVTDGKIVETKKMVKQ